MSAKGHFIGCLLILPLLVFHFLCFIVTLSMGLGVGILAAVLHEICWDQKFYAFWQMYITLVTIFIVIEIFFRVGFDTTLTNWMNKVQGKHRVELYFIPRGLYFLGYMASVGLLYYAYHGAHVVTIPVPDSTTNGTNTTTIRSSPFDGEGDIDPWKTNPLSMSPYADHFHYSLIFFIALAFMMYTMSKENDWTTHRREVMETDQSDPIVRGGVGNFVLFLGAHILMTFIYGLPLVGAVFLARQFVVGPIVTFCTGIFMAILVGIAAMFIERRQPFPTEPMSPPVYAYENHLRIRVAIFQLWLLPFAAGRYFDANRAIALDAQNDDLLVFTVEVGIGIVQAIKIFGNDIFLLKAIFWPPATTTDKDELGDSDGTHPMNSQVSVVSVHGSTQTLDYHQEDEEVKDKPKPVVKTEPVTSDKPDSQESPVRVQSEIPLSEAVDVQDKDEEDGDFDMPEDEPGLDTEPVPSPSTESVAPDPYPETPDDFQY